MVKVVHIMSDGKVLDSVEGVVIPLTPETYPAYKLMAEYCQQNFKKESVN